MDFMMDQRSVLVFAVIGMMVATAIPCGYASVIGYQATTASIGNTITTDYFTIGFYRYVGEEDIENVFTVTDINDFEQISTPLFNDVSLQYTKTDTTYVANSSLNDADIFIIIDATNHNGSTFSFTLNAITESTDNPLPTFHYILGDGTETNAGQTTTNLSSSVAYRFTGIVKYSSATKPADDTDFSYTLSITVSDQNFSLYNGDSSIVLEQSGTITIDDPESAVEALADLNNGEGSPFVGEDATYEFIEGNTYAVPGGGTAYSAQIGRTDQEDNRITNDSGHIDPVTINIPPDTLFVMILTIGGNSSNKTNFTVTIDGFAPSSSSTNTPSGHYTKLIYNSKSNMSDVKVAIRDYDPDGDPIFSTSDHWFSGSIASITVSSSKTYHGYVGLEILFMPSPPES